MWPLIKVGASLKAAVLVEANRDPIVPPVAGETVTVALEFAQLPAISEYQLVFCPPTRGSITTVAAWALNRLKLPTIAKTPSPTRQH